MPGLSAADIAQRLQLRGGLRGVTDWLDVLVSLDVLQRSGEVVLLRVSFLQEPCSGMRWHQRHAAHQALGTTARASVRPQAGDGPAALYSNSTEADSFLAKQSTEYIGGHAVLYHDRHGQAAPTCSMHAHAPACAACAPAAARSLSGKAAVCCAPPGQLLRAARCRRTFPQLLWMEQSLRTGVQPDIARQVVAPVIDTFAGARTECTGVLTVRQQ